MYCKTTLLNELKDQVKTATKAPVIPEGYTGCHFQQWANEVLHKIPQPKKELRKVSEQY